MPASMPDGACASGQGPEGGEPKERSRQASAAAALDEVIALVRAASGVDLGLYRRATIERRVASRLQKLGCADYRQYAERMREDRAEAARLVEHVTIKVSRFFRNAKVYARLEEEILPALWRQAEGRGLRLWSAGCGRGEEPYSLAILLAEAGAAKGEGRGAPTILATDIDETALAFARRGLYPESAFEEMPTDRRERYFLARPGRHGQQYEVSPCLRERVSFFRHNLLEDLAQFGSGRFDLVLCRNVLIYFEAKAQERIFRYLADSLRPGAYLCLGEAEQPPASQRRCFEVIDHRSRLYRKTSPELGQEGRPA